MVVRLASDEGKKDSNSLRTGDVVRREEEVDSLDICLDRVRVWVEGFNRTEGSRSHVEFD